MSDPFAIITEALINGAPSDEVADLILEAAATEQTSEKDQMSYLLNFEEYLDDCDIYAFDGWEDAEVVGAPVIEKFWFICDLKLPKNTDLDGAKRIIGKNDENRVSVSKKNGQYVVRVKVLRRLLDEIELKNRRASELEAKPKPPAEDSMMQQGGF